jgi:hypothetical protein
MTVKTNVAAGVVTVALLGGLVMSMVANQSHSKSEGIADGQSSRPRYLPEYTADGDLILPKNFETWVYVGSPLTPNALNGGMANFPEFHNVYIEPGSY